MPSFVQRLHNEHKARLARLAAAAVEDDGIDLKRRAVRRDTATKRRPPAPPPPPAPAAEEVAPPPAPVRDWLRITMPPSRRIIDAVCERFAISLGELRSNTRTYNVARPRQMCMYLLRRFTTLSYVRIGMLLGGRDHTTIIHGIKIISARLAVPGAIKSAVDELIRELNLAEKIPTLDHHQRKDPPPWPGIRQSSKRRSGSRQF